MTDIAADARIRRDFPALAEAAAVVGSVQIRNRATLAGQHLQRVAGGRHRRRRCSSTARGSSSPARAGPGRIPIDDVLRPLRASRRWRRGELVTAIELPRPSGPTGAVHVRRTRRRGHDLASVTLACAVMRRRRHPDRLRQPRAAAAPRRRRDRGARRSGLVRRAPGWSGSTACSSTPARRRGRCGRAPSTGWRCSASSACGPSPSRSSGWRSGAAASAGMTTRPLELTVNGRPRALEIEPHHTLLEVLRDDLGLTGTKECCLVGECGACTVLVDGRSVDSCLVLGRRGGRLGRRRPSRAWRRATELHPLQAAFLDDRRRAVRVLHPGPARVRRRAPRATRRTRRAPRSRRAWPATCAAAAATSRSSRPVERLQPRHPADRCRAD